MRRNKPRLQLALYARPKHPESPHYALFVTPKSGGETIKYHVKNTIQNVDGVISQPWRYERVIVPDVMLEQRLLARIIIGKVAVSTDMVDEILEKVAVYQVDDADRAQAESFDCRTWIRAALEALKERSAIVKSHDWMEVECQALAYVDRKREQGRWSETLEGQPGVPLLDLTTGKEMVA